MNLILPTVLTAVIFGTYDLFIKLGAGRLDPALGAMLTQIASATTLIIYFVISSLRAGAARLPANWQGVVIVTIAGILIAVALVMTFTILQSKAAKATTTLPTILFIRNLTLVTLGILVLRENVTFVKVLGIATCILGVYLITIAK